MARGIACASEVLCLSTYVLEDRKGAGVVGWYLAMVGRTTFPGDVLFSFFLTISCCYIVISSYIVTPRA